MRLLPQKLESLDGLRGIASVMVFFHHFFLAFNWAWAWDSWGHYLFNGSFAVEIFFVHSGFVLSYSYLKKKDKLIVVSAILRRYIRLTIPLAFSVFFAYVLLKLNWIHSPEFGKETGNSWLASYYNFAPDFQEALKQAIYSTYTDFKSRTTYNPVLWTISTELYCSYAVYFFFLFLGSLRLRYFIYPVLFFLPLKFHGQAFLLGMLMCEFYISDHFLKLPKSLSWIFLLAGLLLSWTNLPWRALAASLIVFSVLLEGPLTKIFLKKPVRLLGLWSFSLYVLHYPLICSLSMALKSWPLLLNCFLTLVVLCLISSLSYILIDRPGIKVSQTWSRLIMNFFLTSRR